MRKELDQKKEQHLPALADLAKRYYGLGFAGHPQWERMIADPKFRRLQLIYIYRGASVPRTANRAT